MSTLKNRVGIGAVVVVLAVAGTVMNSRQSSAHERDENHGLQPYSVNLNLFIEDGTRGTQVQILIPSGKRLIGEYLGGFCAGQAGQQYTIAVLNHPPLGQFPQDQSSIVYAETALSPVSQSGPFPFTSVGQTATFYIDGGTPLNLGAFRAATTGLATCNSQLTGHLIDLP
jgi:hypothetical protein